MAADPHERRVLTDSIIPKNQPGQQNGQQNGQEQANTNTFIGEGPVMGKRRIPTNNRIIRRCGAAPAITGR